jgi:Flp pilus assembly protein TadG
MKRPSPLARIRAARKQDRRGAAMVEMAVCFPIFMLMIMGIIEFGRGLMVSQLLTNAAREGARDSIVDSTTKDMVEASVKQMVVNTVGCRDSDVTVTTTVISLATGAEIANLEDAERRDLVTVAVAVPFDAISFCAGRFLTGQDLDGICAMRKE